jgi:hypothetical protein
LIPDAFTNILIYALIILGCVSIIVTGFCCYLGVLCGKSFKEHWEEIRHPHAVADEDAQSIENSSVDGDNEG